MSQLVRLEEKHTTQTAHCPLVPPSASHSNTETPLLETHLDVHSVVKYKVTSPFLGWGTGGTQVILTVVRGSYGHWLLTHSQTWRMSISQGGPALDTSSQQKPTTSKPTSGQQRISASMQQSTQSQESKPEDPCGPSGKGFTFYLPYEASFVMSFTVDTENQEGTLSQRMQKKKQVQESIILREDFLQAGRWGQNLGGHRGGIRRWLWGLGRHFHQGMAGNEDTILELNGCDGILTFQIIQKNGYKDGDLFDGPKPSWLGYSLLPEGISYQISLTTKIPLSWIEKMTIFVFWRVFSNFPAPHNLSRPYSTSSDVTLRC